jgi:hypothetical protein
VNIKKSISYAKRNVIKQDKSKQENSICNRTDEISFQRFYQQYIKEFQQQLYGVVDDEEILVKLSKE